MEANSITSSRNKKKRENKNKHKLRLKERRLNNQSQRLVAIKLRRLVMNLKRNFHRLVYTLLRKRKVLILQHHPLAHSKHKRSRKRGLLPLNSVLIMSLSLKHQNKKKTLRKRRSNHNLSKLHPLVNLQS